MTEEDLNEQFAQIEVECYKRMVKGKIKYGFFNPNEYNRDLIEEAKEELYDMINYAKMMCMKLDLLQIKLNKKCKKNGGK